MMRTISAHSESTVMIGDRMDTDTIADLEAGPQSVLVLTGITDQHGVEDFAYRPTQVVDSVADLTDTITAPDRATGTSTHLP